MPGHVSGGLLHLCHLRQAVTASPACPRLPAQNVRRQLLADPGRPHALLHVPSTRQQHHHGMYSFARQLTAVQAGVLDVLPGIISKHCAACHAASKDPLGQHVATGPGEAHLQRGLWGCSGAALYRLSRALYCRSLGRLPRKMLLLLPVTRVGFRDAVEGLDGAELPE